MPTKPQFLFLLFFFFFYKTYLFSFLFPPLVFLFSLCWSSLFFSLLPSLLFFFLINLFNLFVFVKKKTSSIGINPRGRKRDKVERPQTNKTKKRLKGSKKSKKTVLFLFLYLGAQEKGKEKLGFGIFPKVNSYVNMNSFFFILVKPMNKRMNFSGS